MSNPEDVSVGPSPPRRHLPHTGPPQSHNVFPGSQTFEKVDTGREGDRVYLLQYTENRSNRFFFWMQVRAVPPAALPPALR